MNGYSEECLKVFLKEQGRLFDEPVAETLEEAEAFLEDCPPESKTLADRLTLEDVYLYYLEEAQ